MLQLPLPPKQTLKRNADSSPSRVFHHLHTLPIQSRTRFPAGLRPAWIKSPSIEARQIPPTPSRTHALGRHEQGPGGLVWRTGRMPICWGSSRDTLHFGASFTATYLLLPTTVLPTERGVCRLHNSHSRGCVVRAALLDSRPQKSQASVGWLWSGPLRDLAISTPSSSQLSSVLWHFSPKASSLLIHPVVFPILSTSTQVHCRVGRSPLPILPCF